MPLLDGRRAPLGYRYLSWTKQKEVASSLVGHVISQQAVVSSAGDAAKLLAFVKPLMGDDPNEKVDADAVPPPIDEDTAAELGPVSRLVHTFASDSTDGQYRILKAGVRQAGQGSLRRSPFTLVPVLFAVLKLTRQVRGRLLAGEEVEVGPTKLLGFASKIVSEMATLAPTLAMRLYLQCALVADACSDEETLAYDFMTEAFTT